MIINFCVLLAETLSLLQNVSVLLTKIGEFQKSTLAHSNTGKSENGFQLAKTPVRLKAMIPYLKSYPDKPAAKNVYNQFKFGFSLYFENSEIVQQKN